MNYVFTGKVLSVLTFLLLKKLTTLNYFELKSFEVILGWFLLEYTYEDYSVTAGNLFFTLKDFRNLISNLGLVFKGIVLNKILILFFQYSIIFSSSLFLCYFLTLKNVSFNVNLFLSFYVYNLICYFLGLDLYWVNMILLFYFIFYFNNSFFLAKLKTYLISFFMLLIYLIEYGIEKDLVMNNFLQENTIKFLFIYSYIYFINF